MHTTNEFQSCTRAHEETQVAKQVNTGMNFRPYLVHKCVRPTIHESAFRSFMIQTCFMDFLLLSFVDFIHKTTG